MTSAPAEHFDDRYGEPDAAPTAWSDAEVAIGAAELYWISTVRADGRVHVTPMIGLWLDATLVFTTGEMEQKALNLRHSPEAAVTTGCNQLHGGTDLVVNGKARRITSPEHLRRIADAYVAKYGEEWRFQVGDGVLVSAGHPAHVLQVIPTTAYAFGKDPYSHTRWDF
jgi:hypothetical protein